MTPTGPSVGEADGAEIRTIEAAEAFHVRDEQSANWALRKLVEQRLYRKRVRKWAEAEIMRSERQEAFLLRRSNWRRGRARRSRGSTEVGGA